MIHRKLLLFLHQASLVRTHQLQYHCDPLLINNTNHNYHKYNNSNQILFYKSSTANHFPFD